MGITTHPQRGWAYLRRLGFRTHMPHATACRRGRPGRASRLEKHLSERIAAGKAAKPNCLGEGWCHDEAGLGRKPIGRKVCAPRGTAPAGTEPDARCVVVRGWLCAPDHGSNRLGAPSHAHTAAMHLALAKFAVGVGAAEQILVVVAHAGWHGSQDRVVLTALELVTLPAVP